MKLSNKVKGAVLFSLLLTVLSSASAFATAYSGNVVILDWTRFSITPEAGTDVTFNYTVKSSTSVVYNGFNSTITFPSPDTQSDTSAWKSTSLILGPTTNYYVQSTTTDVDMTAMAASVSDGNGWVESQADSVRTAFFTVAGSGNVNIQIPYTLAQAMFTTSGSEIALGEARARLEFANLVSESRLSQQQFLAQEVGKVETGLLDLTLPFSDGDSGMFTIEAFTHGIAYSPDAVPTPEPATFVLLGLGVVGIAVYRKKAKS